MKTKNFYGRNPDEIKERIKKWLKNNPTYYIVTTSRDVVTIAGKDLIKIKILYEDMKNIKN